MQYLVHIRENVHDIVYIGCSMHDIVHIVL